MAVPHSPPETSVDPGGRCWPQDINECRHAEVGATELEAGIIKRHLDQFGQCLLKETAHVEHRLCERFLRIERLLSQSSVAEVGVVNGIDHGASSSVEGCFPDVALAKGGRLKSCFTLGVCEHSPQEPMPDVVLKSHPAISDMPDDVTGSNTDAKAERSMGSCASCVMTTQLQEISTQMAQHKDLMESLLAKHEYQLEQLSARVTGVVDDAVGRIVNSARESPHTEHHDTVEPLEEPSSPRSSRSILERKSLDQKSRNLSVFSAYSRRSSKVSIRSSVRRFGSWLNGSGVAGTSFGDQIASVETMLSQRKQPKYDGIGEGFALRLINHSWFDSLVGAIIAINAVFIGLQADWQVRYGPGTQIPQLWRIADTCFCIIFSIELALRAWALRHAFFRGEDWAWNSIDLVIVAAAITEEILQTIDLSGTDVSGMTPIRLLRILRLVRVIKGIHIIPFFRDLRLMIQCISGCLKSLMWCICLLICVQFTFSVIVLEMAAADIHESDSMQYYGSMVLCIYSCFLAITGGIDWGSLARPLGNTSPALVVLFCVYIAFTGFALLNIVTGIFVETAKTLSQQDSENMTLEDIGELKRVVEELKSVFHSLDSSGTGILTWEEFQHRFNDPSVFSHLRRLKLNVDPNGAAGLFQLLDFEDKGSLDIDTFVNRLTSLRGQAKSLDVAKLRADQYRVADRIEGLIFHFEQRLLGMAESDAAALEEGTSRKRLSFV